MIAGKSTKIRKLEQEKYEAMQELKSIKSIQLELVRNSKLERKVIKCDKEIESLQSEQQKSAEKVKYYSWYVRVSDDILKPSDRNE